MKKLKKLAMMIIMALLVSSPAYGETLDVNVITGAPEKPLNLTISGLTDTEVIISWRASSGATQYMVYVNGNQYSGTNSPVVNLKSLEPNSEYEVYVIANNAGGDSSPSEPIPFKTLPVPPAAPDTPALNITGNSVNLSWRPLPEEQEIKSYKIYLDGMFLKKVDEDGSGHQSVILEDLNPGSHSVNISAVNEHKEGPLSKTLSFNISDLLPPGSLKMVNHGMDTVWLSWLPVMGAKTYLVAVDGQILAETYEVKVELEGLSPDTLYKIEVEAVGEAGEKSVPAKLEVKTLPFIEPLNPMGLIEAVKKYLPHLGVYIESVFVVVAALIMAKHLKIALE